MGDRIAASKERLLAATEGGAKMADAALSIGVSYGAARSWIRRDPVFKARMRAARSASKKARQSTFLEAARKTRSIARAAKASGLKKSTLEVWMREDARFREVVHDAFPNKVIITGANGVEQHAIVGCDHHKATIPASAVIEIKSAYEAKSGGYRQLARQFGVDRGTIRDIIKGRRRIYG